mmetsp:Transcript_60972/g.84810  ORF Transcript_60972/g.84810 Transcript_60972/m.84810 type:complete len:105 (-) Transcript_60972:658-972(-)
MGVIFTACRSTCAAALRTSTRCRRGVVGSSGGKLVGLGALKRRVTCNCGPRGTVSCGFQVSKEQLEEERKKRGNSAFGCPTKSSTSTNLSETGEGDRGVGGQEK